jgi:hypothetical protein
MTVALRSSLAGGRHPCMLVPMLVRGRFGPNRRQAARAAEALSRIVDCDLELVRAVPIGRRARQSDRLAALDLSAQAYRHYANGWIGRRELRRRLRAQLDELVKIVPNRAAAAPAIQRIEVIRSVRRPRG